MYLREVTVKRVYALAAVLAMSVFAIVGIWGVVHYFTFTPSQKIVSQSFWAPDGTEIYSRNEVEPGTFKIKKSLEEFQATTQPGQQVVVVYNQYTSSPGVYFEYFRARPDGIFDYTSTFIRKPMADGFFTGWDVQVNEKEATVQYTANKSGGGIAVSFIFLVIAIVIGALVTLWTRRIILQRRERNPAPYS